MAGETGLYASYDFGYLIKYRSTDFYLKMLNSRSCSSLIGLLLVLAMTGASHVASAGNSSIDTARSIVAGYRDIIVLFIDEEQLTEREQERGGVIGKIIYHENRDLLAGLGASLERQYHSSVGEFEAFLDWLETDKSLWDADKLVFREMLTAVHSKLTAEQQASRDRQRIQKRLSRDIDDLKHIRLRYDKEISRVFDRFTARAIEDRRQSWNRYLSFIKTRTSRAKVVQNYDPDNRLLPGRRGKQTASWEVFGRRFPKKTIALTFDDGPHSRYTDRILAILKERGIKATFFEVGKSVGKIENNKVVLLEDAAVSKRILGDGHLLANHSYTHSVMPKQKPAQVKQEIVDTNRILKEVSGAKPAMFRAPYGARNDSILATVKNLEMKSILWNIDSRDWADPIPRSVARRVMEQVDRRQHGIILFHDVQASTVEALPYVIDGLIARGYTFAQWNGKKFSREMMAPLNEPPRKKLSLYRNKWAVVIGINKYQHWPELKYAVNDAKGMRELLVNEFGFSSERVITLYDEQATRSGIISALMEQLGDPDKVKKNDSVFVFYAGHGATRHLPSGRDLGYIIPYEAQADKYFGSAISMTNFRDITEVIPAKHVFFVMDSCYSGLALTRGAGLNSRNFLEENAKRVGRQIITAGGADQQVADDGPYGHSVFTWTILQGLKGQGDLNKDGFITASELSAYVSPIVSSISLQTPAFGNMVGSAGGDYVFELKDGAGFLSETTENAGEQEVALNRKLDTLQQEIEEKRARNLKLQKELANVKAMLEANAASMARNSHYDRARSVELNEAGLKQYRSKNLDGALKSFLEAAKVDPSYSEATNNVGFVYFRLKRYKESADWLEKTTLLDPKRAVSWLNLGDSYVQLKMEDKAREAYKTYLSLVPKGTAAESARSKLAKLR